MEQLQGSMVTCVRLLSGSEIFLNWLETLPASEKSPYKDSFVDIEMPKHCEVQAGELEFKGMAVEYLGRTKVRSKDAIITIPDEKHVKAVIAAAGISAKDRNEVPSKQLNWKQNGVDLNSGNMA